MKTKHVLALGLIIAVTAITQASCNHLFGQYANPHDPESPNYLPGSIEYLENFKTDVFANGGWTRTDTSVTVDTSAGILQISSDGSYNDGASINLSSLNLSFPLSIQTRMRLVNGGRGYLLPWLTVYPKTGGTQSGGGLSVTYLPGAQYGWNLGGWTRSQVNAPTAENIWATLTAIIRSDGGELYVELDGQSTTTLVAKATWSISGPLDKISFSQPWDADCEMSFMSVSE